VGIRDGNRLRFSCRNQAARHLDARSVGFHLADQPGGAVARDFLELVPIDLGVATRPQVSRARQRPKHGEDRRRGHECKGQP
jgi:hypothetical protein